MWGRFRLSTVADYGTFHDFQFSWHIQRPTVDVSKFSTFFSFPRHISRPKVCISHFLWFSFFCHFQGLGECDQFGSLGWRSSWQGPRPDYLGFSRHCCPSLSLSFLQKAAPIGIPGVVGVWDGLVGEIRSGSMRFNNAKPINMTKNSVCIQHQT